MSTGEDPNLDFVDSMSKKHLGPDGYPCRQLGDEQVILYVRPLHTTRMGK